MAAILTLIHVFDTNTVQICAIHTEDRVFIWRTKHTVIFFLSKASPAQTMLKIAFKITKKIDFAAAHV